MNDDQSYYDSKPSLAALESTEDLDGLTTAFPRCCDERRERWRERLGYPYLGQLELGFSVSGSIW